MTARRAPSPRPVRRDRDAALPHRHPCPRCGTRWSCTRRHVDGAERIRVLMECDECFAERCAEVERHDWRAAYGHAKEAIR